MTKIQLLNMLVQNAKEFRQDRDWFTRNNHMHDLTENETPSLEVVDAVLSSFINHVAGIQGVDYGLYAKDLKKEG